MNLTGLFLVVLTVGVLVHAARLVVRLNLLMPELWSLLEAKGRGHRVEEVRDRPWSNVPSTRYLYDQVDFDDPEIRALKLRLKTMHRSGIWALLLFGVAAAATLAVWGF